MRTAGACTTAPNVAALARRAWLDDELNASRGATETPAELKADQIAIGSPTPHGSSGGLGALAFKEELQIRASLAGGQM